MSLRDASDRIAERGLAAAGRLAFIAPLATRIVLGLTFVQTGWGKWRHFQDTAAYFARLGIPFPQANAGLVATLELIGGAALIAGLLTRLFAAGLSASMTVALLTADRQAFLASWGPTAQSSPTDVTSFVLLLFLLWLVLHGPGAVSVDRGLWRRPGSVGGAAPAARAGGSLKSRQPTTAPGGRLEEKNG